MTSPISFVARESSDVSGEATAEGAASDQSASGQVASSGALTNLAALAHDVAAAADVRDIYRALFTFARAVSPSEAIFVALYDPATRLRTCVYSAGPDREDDVSGLPPMPLSGSPQSIAIETSGPVVTADLQAALSGKPVIDLGTEADPRLPQSSLAVPMIVLGRTIGALEVQSLQVGGYTEEDVAAIVMAAGIAALAIDRARSPELTSVAATQARRDLRRIIRERKYRPVFQPIVELSTATTVGYEALTRFADGVRPDVRFDKAAAVGVGLELEAVTLAAAIGAAARLPAGVFLNLNVSPAAILAGEPLAGILRGSEASIVLELTEHAVVDDYDDLRRAIARLGDGIRLAVDDAGAGFASFRHILELRPQFVKIDRGIVAGINTDPARQALVAGMHHFSTMTSCDLIAEGIETEAEMQTLRSLGILFGQGYLLGRPRDPG